MIQKNNSRFSIIVKKIERFEKISCSMDYKNNLDSQWLTGLDHKNKIFTLKHSIFMEK